MESILWAFEGKAPPAEGGIHIAAKELMDIQKAWHFDGRQLVAQRLVADMLSLPTPWFRPMYYNIVLNSVCAGDPPFAKSMAKVIGTHFRSISNLKWVQWHRLACFLAYHLSVFGLGWPWNKWEHVADQEPGEVQRKFVETVLDQLVRLTYHKRVKESLPERLVPLMPPENPNNFPYESPEASDASTISAEVAARIRQHKQSADELLSWLTSKVQPQLGGEATFDAVAYTLLHIGAKSPTHLSTALRRYKPVLDALCPPEQPSRLLTCACEYWRFSPQHLTLCFDRCVQEELVTRELLLEFIFGRNRIDDNSLADSLWEALEHLLTCVVKEAEGARDESRNAEKKLKTLSERRSRLESELESAGTHGEEALAKEQQLVQEQSQAEDRKARAEASAEQATEAAGRLVERVLSLLASRVDEDPEDEAKLEQLRFVLRTFGHNAPSPSHFER